MRSGITGHQRLGGAQTSQWVAGVLVDMVKKHQITEGVSCLAVGTDQIFAAALKRLGIPYLVVIPCDRYEQTFTETQDLESYRSLLSTADEVIRLPFDEPSEVAFFEAGKKVVDLSSIVIAVWDGAPARGLGGTADVVRYARSIGRRVLQINPITKHFSAI
jgi:hypothetical protein